MSDFINPEALILTFGPYKGFSLAYVRDSHPSYLDKIIGNFGLPEWWRVAAAKVMMREPIAASILPSIKRAPKVPEKDAIIAFYVTDTIVGIQARLNKHQQDELQIIADGARFDVDAGYWRIPIAHAVSAIKYLGGPDKVKIQKKVQDLCLAYHKNRKKLRALAKKDSSDLIIPGMIKPPFPFQKADVEFGIHAGGRFMLAHETGVGKTASAIAHSMYHGHKTLVAMPKKVKIGWERAIKEFTDIDACVWDGEGPHGDLNAPFHLINYDLVEKHRFDLAEQDFTNFVGDECTHLKNYKSGRTKSIFGKWDERKLYPGIKTDHALLLSATYVVNRPQEAFTLFHYLAPDKFSNPRAFLSRYGDGNMVPYRNLDELHERTKDLVIRRTLADTAGEMPMVRRSPVWIELSADEMESYRRAEREMFNKWKTVGRPSAAQIPMLRHNLFPIKMRETIEFVEHTGRPFLIFVIHPDHAYQFEEHYKGQCRVITGDTNGKTAQRNIDDLAAGKAKYGIFTIGSAAEGIDGLQNLFADVFFVDRWWVPGKHDQAEGRTRRRGQTAQVRSWYLTAAGTYDEHLAGVLTEKQINIDTIVDGKVREEMLRGNIFRDFISKLSQSAEFGGSRWQTVDDTELLP